jgi:hypothetical protein
MTIHVTDFGGCGGLLYPIGVSRVFFRTMTAATKAGKAALKQLLSKLNT